MTPTLDALVRQLRGAMAEVPCSTYLPFRDDNGFIACQNCGQSETTHTLITAVGAAIAPLLDALTAAQTAIMRTRRVVCDYGGDRPYDGDPLPEVVKAHFEAYIAERVENRARVEAAEAEAARLREQVQVLERRLNDAEQAQRALRAVRSLCEDEGIQGTRQIWEIADEALAAPTGETEAER